MLLLLTYMGTRIVSGKVPVIKIVDTTKYVDPSLLDISEH